VASRDDFDEIAREISERHALDYLATLDALDERRRDFQRREALLRAGASERFGRRVSGHRIARFLASKRHKPTPPTGGL
jgi:hypothetical protein